MSQHTLLSSCYCTNEKNTEKFKVLHSDVLGRYAVASCDIAEDELIHEELPFAVGPKSDSRVVCLECFCPLDGSASGARCEYCEWPLCLSCNAASSRNAGLKYHEAECQVFWENGVKFQNVADSTKPCPQFECITPLRVLLAIEKNPKFFEQQVSLMEYHDVARRASAFWDADQQNIVNFLLTRCKFEGRFARELIERVIGVLDINVFEARTETGHPLRCLYPIFGVVAHSCVPNTSHSIKASEGFKLRAFSTQKIQKDESIFACYTFTLATTHCRQRHLQKSKYFTCLCERCRDPTELGTQLSAFKCIRCNSGYLTSKNPLDPSVDWRCNECAAERYGPDINRCVDLMQTEIDNLFEKENPYAITDELESMYNAYKNVLHDGHFIMQTIRFHLVSLYSNSGEGEEDVNALRRKIEFCDILLKLLKTIEPGKTRTRAELLNEKCGALLAVSQLDFKNGSLDQVDFNKNLTAMLKMLEECILIWKREDPESQEGSMIRSTQETREKINKKINELRI
ncbi:SET domain-containing protein SmydA-8-like [Culicoides brevitarsis]|uniref:SET domain-containing protein SmydA-8-like n=1 Tax=Culicoides brevitarsis TaxID=469753 RepID=UPI00307C2248